MARAIAKCTCKTCGKEFEFVKHDFANRRAADEWTAWAEANITQCYECRKKEDDLKKKRSPLTVQASIGNVTENGVEILLTLISDNTYQRKDEIKSAGFKWIDGRWVFPIIITSANEIKSALSDATSKLESSLGMLKKCGRLNKNELESKLNIYQKNKTELKNMGQRPEFSAEIQKILNGGRWNGKVYGKVGNYSIYLSRNEVRLTDEQAKSIQHVLNARAEWDRKRQKLTEGTEQE